MAIRLKIPTGRQTGKPGRGWSFQDPLLRAALVVFLVLATVGGAFFTYYYVKFGRMIDQRFKGPVFGNSARIYAVARPVQVGEKIEAKEIALQLRRAGYDQSGKSPMGSYRLFEGGIEIKPGSDSYHSPESAIIRVRGGKIESITSKSGDLAAYELEPQMITSLFDAGDRSKRQLVTYDEIPKLMVDAVLAIEDRRFFQHGGVNFLRLAEATWIDVTHGRHEQGGSTITMQLSRKFFLTPEKTIKRKLSEMLIAVEMEQKLSKQQIFEFYANRVDLGQRGSFTINGFGQAAQAYFNKDLKDVTPAEAALIAGIIQAPSYLSPYRHPERALERRNLVLDAMVETHTLTQAEAEKAKATPLEAGAAQRRGQRRTLLRRSAARHADHQARRAPDERPGLSHLLDYRSRPAKGSGSRGAERHEAGGRPGNKTAHQAQADRKEQVRDHCPARTAGPGSDGGHGSAHR